MHQIMTAVHITVFFRHSPSNMSPFSLAWGTPLGVIIIGRLCVITVAGRRRCVDPAELVLITHVVHRAPSRRNRLYCSRPVCGLRTWRPLLMATINSSHRRHRSLSIHGPAVRRDPNGGVAASCRLKWAGRDDFHCLPPTPPWYGSACTGQSVRRSLRKSLPTPNGRRKSNLAIIIQIDKRMHSGTSRGVFYEFIAFTRVLW